MVEGSYWLGGAFTVLGLGAVVYTAQHLKGKRLRLEHALLGALILTWVFFGYDIYDRHRTASFTFDDATWAVKPVSHEQWDKPLIQVWDKTFNKEHVPLDGIEYIDCTFNENVVFDYEGTAGTRITTSAFNPGTTPVVLTSHNPLVNQTIMISSALNQLTGGKTVVQCGPNSDIFPMPPK